MAKLKKAEVQARLTELGVSFKEKDNYDKISKKLVKAEKKAAKDAPEPPEAPETASGDAGDEPESKKASKPKNLGKYQGMKIVERSVREVNGKEYTYLVLDDSSTYLLSETEVSEAGL